MHNLGGNHVIAKEEIVHRLLFLASVSSEVFGRHPGSKKFWAAGDVTIFSIPRGFIPSSSKKDRKSECDRKSESSCLAKSRIRSRNCPWMSP